MVRERGTGSPTPRDFKPSNQDLVALWRYLADRTFDSDFRNTKIPPRPSIAPTAPHIIMATSLPASLSIPTEKTTRISSWLGYLLPTPPADGEHRLLKRRRASSEPTAAHQLTPCPRIAMPDPATVNGGIRMTCFQGRAHRPSCHCPPAYLGQFYRL